MSQPELLEKIIDHFTDRLRNGKHPAIADYQERYPQLKDEIAEVLSSVAMIEQLKNSETRSDANSRFDSVSHLTEIGDYEIVRELGRGGMGIVFEAVHQTLGRRVAVKVMPTPLLDGQKQIERFQREAQAAARLHHTNIVGVFGVGKGDGFLYYVMDWIDGQSLAETVDNARAATDATTSVAGHAVVEAKKLSPRQVARIGAQIADALSYAHNAGLFHRDIKPGNIILDRSGTPWITDFGLVKDASGELNLTKTGDVIGTPQYLAPESLESHYDQRSEVYCLGLTLYELVTLQPAFSPGTTAEVIRAVATATPVSPRKIDPDVPLDLATIIAKSISRDPELRYPSAADLRNDLLAFLENRPIVARQPSWWESTLRWARQNPLPAALSATSAVLLTMVAVTATLGYLATTDALEKEAQKSESLRLQQLATAAARDESEQNFRQMKAQHERAEANVALTIEAFDEIFKQIVARNAATIDELDIDGFREIAGIETSLTKTDADFLNRLIPFYQQFAQLNAGNSELQVESAKAYRRMGNIYQLVGDMPAAIDAYQQSVELYQSIYPDASQHKQQLLTVVEVQNEMSAVQRKNGDAREAWQWNQMSLDLLDSSPLSESDPEVRLELARTLSVSGFNLFRARSLLGTTGRDVEEKLTMAWRNRNRQNFRQPRAAGRSGGSPDVGGQRALKRAGKPVLDRQSKQEINAAIDILDELVAQWPENQEYRSVRATCFCILAAANLSGGRDVVQEYGFQMRDRAIAEIESLLKLSPHNAEFRYLLALASALSGPDSHPDDIRMLNRAVAIAGELVESFPHLLDYHHLHASLNIKLARHHLSQREHDSAWNLLQSSNKSIEYLLDRTPSDRSFLPSLMALHSELQRLSRELRERGDNRQSQAVQKMARDLRNKARSTITSPVVTSGERDKR